MTVQIGKWIIVAGLAVVVSGCFTAPQKTPAASANRSATETTPDWKNNIVRMLDEDRRREGAAAPVAPQRQLETAERTPPPAGGGTQGQPSGAAGAKPVARDVPAASEQPRADDASASTRLIAPGDRLRIRVEKIDELTTEGPVNEAGAIVMPVVGAVPVAGLTVDLARAHVTRFLATDFLVDPRVELERVPMVSAIPQKAQAAGGTEVPVPAARPGGGRAPE